MMLTRLWTCHWARRRLQRYLDADPSAPLTAREVRRLETHLATCARCAELTEEYRGLRRAFAAWSQRRAPDPALLARVHTTVQRLVAGDVG